MPRAVIYAPSALRDLDSVKQWLLQPGHGETAKRKLRNIRAALWQLRETPCRWALGEHVGVREIPVDGYRVLYEVIPDTGDNGTAGNVHVLRVFGPGQERTCL